jgi:protein-tyrosine phosphatase
LKELAIIHPSTRLKNSGTEPVLPQQHVVRPPPASSLIQPFCIGHGAVHGKNIKTPTTATMLKSKPGDRVKEDHGEEVVITPPAEPSEYHYNFGPASGRDEIVFTCERPGGDTKGAMIPTTSQVSKWMAFMSTKQISHVIILLEEPELKAYEPPGLIPAYQDAGMIVHHIPYSSPNAATRILEILEEVSQKNNKKAVAHCTHGMGRSGRVAAAWLVQKYHLTPLDAVEEALEAARTAKVERMGAPRQLQEWMG